MIRVAITLCVVLGIAACGNLRRDAQSFDGQFFRSSVKNVAEDKREIEVSVRDASKSIEGAQEAGRLESVKYCIENYGNSEVTWVVGPDDDPSTYVLSDGTLVLRGACVG